jgi:hypothetical protein
MALYVYVRKNGGRVEKTSTSQVGSDDPALFDELVDPTVVEPWTDAMFWTGLVVRDATQTERDNFPIAEADDAVVKDRAQAEALLSTNRIIKAIVNEVNARIPGFKQAVHERIRSD